jgi:hypothetical protein
VIAPQTKIAFVGYILLIIAKLLLFIKHGNRQTYPMSIVFVFAIVWITLLAISLYVLNCTVVGQCNFYAWFVAYTIVILGILSVLFLIYSFVF